MKPTKGSGIEAAVVPMLGTGARWAALVYLLELMFYLYYIPSQRFVKIVL
jgi:hypothetical protein